MGLHRKLAVQFLEKYNEPRESNPEGRYLVIRLGARISRDEEMHGSYFTKTIANADQKIDLVKGFIDHEELAADFDGRWDYIQIVNLKRLEQATDKMLEKL
jgi:hypothetical protein